jgi:alpha-amylase/alpha-mannosidase (GH57 family)
VSKPGGPSSTALPAVSHAHPTALVVHGHFYQPPRENPWTDEITREPSAAPFHDWNERILAECYRANAFARIFGPSEDIQGLVNNYAHISFNVGPTLARFIARRDPTTVARMAAGDAEQISRLGLGGGMAQVWGHPIAPLLSPRDRRTQIAWGQADFEGRFGRQAEGMWLPETAADPATLEDLIDAGVQYTILAPEQIAQVRPPGGAWKPVNRDTLDTGRGYRFVHGDGSGRSINLAIFDGPLSRELAFGTATRDSESFLSTIKSCAERSGATGRRLVLAASDGELYGHHKKFSDLMLAHALTTGAAKDPHLNVTNLGAYLRDEPPTWEAELAKGPLGEGTAWSCAHGLGRWLRHCGCAMRSPDESGWSQSWRAPLRAALDGLRDHASVLFEDVGGDLFDDPWAVRDAFGSVLDAPPLVRRRFLIAHGRGKLAAGKAGVAERALLLMELSRSTLLMYASCGWFFDDVAGIESALVIRQAAYVLDLWKRFAPRPPVKEFLARLGEARSNLPHAGTGADVFARVARQRTTGAEAAAAVAFSHLAKSDGGTSQVPGFAVRANSSTWSRSTKSDATTKGQLSVTNERTGETEAVSYQAQQRSPLGLVATVKAPISAPSGRRIAIDDLPDELRDPVVRELVERLSRGAKITPRDCRAAIELGRSSAGAGDQVDPMFHELLARLIVRLLAVETADAAKEETLAAVLELLLALPEDRRFEPQSRIQEWIWSGLGDLRGKGRHASVVLRALAEKVGLREGVTAGGESSRRLPRQPPAPR